MRANFSKSKLIVEQIEYLVYWIIRQSIQPICKKVDMNVTLNIMAPKTRKARQTTPIYLYSQLLSQHLLL
jgi:hypothetical protein